MTISSLHQKATAAAAHIANGDRLFQELLVDIEKEIHGGACSPRARKALIEMRPQLAKGDIRIVGEITRELRPHVEPTEVTNVA
jgi:hypothetical protein